MCCSVFSKTWICIKKRILTSAIITNILQQQSIWLLKLFNSKKQFQNVTGKLSKLHLCHKWHNIIALAHALERWRNRINAHSHKSPMVDQERMRPLRDFSRFQFTKVLPKRWSSVRNGIRPVKKPCAIYHQTLSPQKSGGTKLSGNWLIMFIYLCIVEKYSQNITPLWHGTAYVFFCWKWAANVMAVSQVNLVSQFPQFSSSTHSKRQPLGTSDTKVCTGNDPELSKANFHVRLSHSKQLLKILTQLCHHLVC